MITRQSEVEVLWQLKERNFSQVRRELGIGYGTLRRLLEREIWELSLYFSLVVKLLISCIKKPDAITIMPIIAMLGKSAIA